MSSEESLIVKLPILFPRPSIREGRTRTSIGNTTASPPATIRAKITTYFSQSQLQLALSIQKSKPEGMSTEQYCEQLLQHVRYNRGLPPARPRYIESCEFWKNQYENIHFKNRKLEKEIESLRDAKELHHAMRPSDGIQDEGSLVRHLLITIANNEQNEDQLLRKRPTPPQSIEELSNNDSHKDTVTADHSLELAHNVLRVGKQRVILQKMIKETITLDHINRLAEQTFHLLDVISLVPTECCCSLQLLRTDSGDTQNLVLFQQVMEQVAFAFLSCFSALEELCRTIPGRSRKSELVYRMVLFFSMSLSLLHNISSRQAEHERAQHRSSRAKRIRVEEPEYAASKYLATMLVSICDGIPWKSGQAGHSDLLEGILVSILEHTGRLVSGAVFNEHVATSDNPGNITTDITTDCLELAKFEHRYVIQVLHAALGGTRRKHLVTQVIATGKANPHGAENYSQVSGKMLSKARLLLQSTLVKSAVGGNDLETLRIPTPPAEISISSVKETSSAEKYGSQWLVETVWALIGWDLVA